MNVVIAQILLLIMMVTLAATLYYFFRSSISKAQASARESATKIVSAVEENIKITSVNRKNITIVNRDGETEILAIYLDSNKLNFSPSIIPENSFVDVKINEIVYDPISRIRRGDKLIVITKTGNRWEYELSGTKVDEILTLDNFTVISGNWTQDTYIHGE